MPPIYWNGNMTGVAVQPTEETSTKWRVLKDFAVAISVANVAFTRIWWELLTYTQANTFLMKAPPTRAAYLAAMLNVLLLGAILTAGTVLLRKHISERRAKTIVTVLAAVVFACIAGSLLVSISGRYPILRRVPTRLIGQNAAILLLSAAVIISAHILFVKQKIRAAVILLPFVPVTFGQAAWKAFQYDPRPFTPAALAEFLPVAPDSPRIVWLIFDRLDQRLTYVDRPAYINLPEFDRLRHESAYAKNAFPPAAYTIWSLPALTHGEIVGYDREIDRDTLLIRFHKGRTIEWGAHPNIFSQARANGFNSGIVGWYLPYCRVFATTVSSCEWFDMARQSSSYDVEADTAGGVPVVMLNEARSVFETNLISPFGQSLATVRHARTYEASMRAARAAVVDPRLNLVLLHLPIPHGPFFYNRNTGKYDLQNSLVKGYVDSLVLADGTVGALRRDLTAAGLWDRTSLLVSSDHANGSARRLDGKSDPRVPFVLKLAGQDHGVELSSHFNTVMTKDLLMAILKRDITTPEQVREWVDHHRSMGRSPYDPDM